MPWCRQRLRARYKWLAMGLPQPLLDDHLHREMKAFAPVIGMYLDTHRAKQLCTYRALTHQHLESSEQYLQLVTSDHQRRTLPRLCVFA